MVNNVCVKLLTSLGYMAWEVSGYPHSSLGELGLLVTTLAAVLALVLPLALAARRRRRRLRADDVD